MQDRLDSYMLLRAEEKAIQQEIDSSLVMLDLSVQYQVPFGQTVCVTGSVRELGDWDPKRSVRMSWYPNNIWKVSFEVKRHQVERLEYKFVVETTQDASDYIWEGGSNHNILALPTRRIEIQDRWGFPGYKHDIAI